MARSSLSTTAFGVFGGTKKPLQAVAVIAGKPDSVAVGTSGKAADRVALVTAMPLSLPDCTSGAAGGSVTDARSIWSDIAAVSAGAAPWNGTFCRFTPGSVVSNFSMTRCGIEPVPGEP